MLQCTRGVDWNSIVLHVMLLYGGHYFSLEVHTMYFNHTHPYQLNKPGRLDSDSVPTLQHSAAIMDFTFDPFDNYRLASGVCVQWCVCVCVYNTNCRCTLVFVLLLYHYSLHFVWRLPVTYHYYYMYLACDDAYIRVWQVPDGGLTETLTEPLVKLKGTTTLCVHHTYTCYVYFNLS